MPKLTKNIVIGIVVAVILIFGGILIYALLQKGKIPQVEVPLPTPTPQTIEGILEPGTIGEIGKTPEGSPAIELPPVIFNTTGIITEVKKDRLMVQGDGLNFTDGISRELTLIFTDSTITFEPGQKVRYQGLDGLKHFKKGEKISISSPENIRGKTQFIVDYINKF